MVERLTYVRSTYVMCGDLEQLHLPKKQKGILHMQIIEFFLPMDPPTATHQEKKINWKTKSVYPDPAASDARAKLRAHLAQHVPEHPFSGPIRMTVIWGFRKHMGKHSNGDWHTGKPDLDNAQKALQDVMTELGFWKDDCYISNLSAMKIWTWHPGISVILEELGENVYADGM